MSNNTSSDCIISDFILDATDKIYLATYYVITPFYFLISIFGNIVMLKTFREQSKKDKAYGYQFLLTISQSLEAVTFTLFVVMYKWWSGAENAGADWFKRVYVLMWYSAHASIPLMNCFTTSSLLLSFVMAGDRVVALSSPFKYKNLPHRTIQRVAAIVCFSVGISSNIFDCFRYIVLPKGDTYTIGTDEDYVASTAAGILSQVRMAIRVIGLVGLVAMNVALTVMFKQRAKKVAQMTNSDSKEKARRDAERQLLLLTIWQSFLTALAIIPVNCCYILVYVDIAVIICWGNQLFLFADFAFAVAESIDFFAVLAIDKKLRRMIKLALPCYKNRVVDMNSTMAVTQSQAPSTRLFEMSRRHVGEA